MTFRQIGFQFLCLVYDVTKFLEDHPGGDDILLSATGIFAFLCLYSNLAS
ncbi:putative cytochrome b5-like heme/steroid binding domain, cytochrome b5, heme-binding protein [Helianthus annuus]|uniref:Cytochrome b5-like heme/steroid binding domain-containing protein n=1 Tax=Helianthus annuus TaxID=4232 RepID=A0A9K3IMV3_HELAN|nr:putative cytochrome b5-like heme/steroid binding domain-containing protein [Helianthus annuus]KAJ0550919.1 putative cytochrome b5-like heme/steroid binding domain, cytochrome b5, heme-binding protein [Helianthus annuus]KAJ0729221.1 putative cytochrome b5-like heme/steroid binding domain, cytochrome b5, heme-binding protein [Helianthus annuus]KAJ0955104.1 putative cytochrome b5-like heme/steroid binding domain, cytochrome b5, heme-binding protein [Helianthus annuus]